MNHPNEEHLLAAAGEAQVPPEIQAHLDQGCMDCAFRLQSYTRILKALRLGRPDEVPGAWLKQAAAAVRERLADARTAQSDDSFLAEPVKLDELAMVRGRRMSSSRRVWRAGPFEVDLASIEGGALVGQVLSTEPGRDLPEDAACILYPDGEPIVVPLEGNGDFHIAQPPRGTFALCIEGDGLRILLEDVELDQRAG